MLKIQYVDKEIPLSTRDSGNQNFIKLRNSGVDKPGEDGIQVIGKGMPLADMAANQVQTELVIDLLEEKITNIEALHLVFPDQCVGIERYQNLSLLFFFFFFIEIVEPFPDPAFRVFTSVFFFNLFKVAKLFYCFTRISSVFINRADNVITPAPGGLIIFQPHGIHLKM